MVRLWRPKLEKGHSYVKEKRAHSIRMYSWPCYRLLTLLKRYLPSMGCQPNKLVRRIGLGKHASWRQNHIK